MVQALEDDPGTDVILGTGTQAPSVPFERAEFVRTDQNYSILNRIVKATKVDTILHTFMITNSVTVPRRQMHEINVIGTMNLLAAAGAAGSSVRHIVVKSSTLVYGSAASDPNTFLEDTPRASPVKNGVERALVEAEQLVRDFSEDNPGTKVTVLRFANVLGSHLATPISRNLSRPVCPAIFGFDPLLQFVAGGRRGAGPPARDPGGHPGPLQRGRRRAASLERGGGHLRHPTDPPLPLQPAQDPSALPALRPARGAGGPAALRARRGHAATGGDGFRVPRHQRRSGPERSSGRCACAASPAGRRCRTPTSTTSSSSSDTRRRCSAPARADVQLLNLRSTRRRGSARGGPTPRR